MDEAPFLWLQKVIKEASADQTDPKLKYSGLSNSPYSDKI